MNPLVVSHLTRPMRERPNTRARLMRHLQIRNRRGKKTRRLTARDDPMVECQTQRQDPMHGGNAGCRHYLLVNAPGAENRDSGRHNHGSRIFTGDHAEIRQRDRIAAQFFWRNPACPDVGTHPVKPAAQIRWVAERDVA